MIITINNIELNKYELLHLINSGKKINAIKLVKDQVNIGLKECKDIIDNLEENPNFYDGKPFQITSTITKFHENVQHTKPFKGNHIIKKSTNYKNYVILLLLICVTVLIYLYLTK